MVLPSRKEGKKWLDDSSSSSYGHMVVTKVTVEILKYQLPWLCNHTGCKEVDSLSTVNVNVNVKRKCLCETV